MVAWEGKVRFDNTFSFGACPAPGVFGRLADLLVHLLKFMLIEEILKWVDDFVFFRSPCGGSKGRFVYRYDEKIFFELGDKLGWIWESTKHTPFSSKFTHISFDWNKAPKLRERRRKTWSGHLTTAPLSFPKDAPISFHYTASRHCSTGRATRSLS
jgi:hypothetical protein